MYATIENREKRVESVIMQIIVHVLVHKFSKLHKMGQLFTSVTYLYDFCGEYIIFQVLSKQILWQLCYLLSHHLISDKCPIFTFLKINKSSQILQVSQSRQ